MLVGCPFTKWFSFSDQPGMLCSFKISSAWSCAWCLNPQFDKTFSTGLSRRYLYYATADVALVLWSWSKKRLFAGLSHRVILKHAETGRTQTYSTGSDVLAQQFAQRVRHLFNWMSCAQFDKGNGHIHGFVCRCPCCLMDADQGKSSALTYGSGVAGITTGRPVASISSRPSPPCASCRMRTTCLLLTCWARSALVYVY